MVPLSLVAARHSKEITTPAVESSSLQATLSRSQRRNHCIYDTKLHGTSIRQRVHGSLANVEADTDMVDGQDFDLVSAVLELPARSAAGRVPASNGVGAANVGEVRQGALRGESGQQAV